VENKKTQISFKKAQVTNRKKHSTTKKPAKRKENALRFKNAGLATLMYRLTQTRQ
jgi:hypothetical protein